MIYPDACRDPNWILFLWNNVWILDVILRHRIPNCRLFLLACVPQAKGDKRLWGEICTLCNFVRNFQTYFPQGGANIRFSKISRKLHEIERIWAPPPPEDPAMLWLMILSYHRKSNGFSFDDYLQYLQKRFDKKVRVAASMTFSLQMVCKETRSLKMGILLR